MTRQEDFYVIVEQYNQGIEPLESWRTTDIVRLIEVLDAELQNRAEAEMASAYDEEQAAIWEERAEWLREHQAEYEAYRRGLGE